MITYRSNPPARSIRPSRHYVGKFDAPIANSPPPCQHKLPEPQNLHGFDFRAPATKAKPTPAPKLVANKTARPAPTPLAQFRARNEERNAQIVELAALGLPNKAIAVALGCAIGTVAGVRFRHNKASK